MELRVSGQRFVRSLVPSMLTSLVRAAAIAAVAVVAVAPVDTLGAQAAPAVRDLPKPVREIEEPYSLISAVRENARGMVFIADAMETEVTRVDFATGERTPLGRQGAGPGEYRMPGGIYRLRGDTVWVLDPAQQRVTVFLPDHKGGVPFQLMLFDQPSRQMAMAPFLFDEKGVMYSNALPIGESGPNLQIPDSISVMRFDPRTSGSSRQMISKLRFPTSGKPEMRVDGQVIHYKMNYPGLVTADSWAVFPDGRIAIVHGHNYTVEMVAPNGTRTTGRPIAYDRIPVTSQDQTAEMTEAKKQLADQMKAVQKTMPAGMRLEIDMPPPETWPSHYPAIAPMQIHAAPDGMLWVRRSMPTRLDREHWDVINPQGNLVARWRVPARTRLVGVGNGVVYTVRLDEDDLQYLQRIAVK